MNLEVANAALVDRFLSHSPRTFRAIPPPPVGTPVALRSEALALLLTCARLPSLHLPSSVPGQENFAQSAEALRLCASCAFGFLRQPVLATTGGEHSTPTQRSGNWGELNSVVPSGKLLFQATN